MPTCSLTIRSQSRYESSPTISWAYCLTAELRGTQEFGKPVSIGSDVWVGGGAIILLGVTIGSKTVIGAGSVVTKDIPDGVAAAGNLCRIIRKISESDDGTTT